MPGAIRMPSIKTTCIGAYPKPDYVPIIDWFDQNDGEQNMSAKRSTQSYESRRAGAGNHAEMLFVRAAATISRSTNRCLHANRPRRWPWESKTSNVASTALKNTAQR